MNSDQTPRLEEVLAEIWERRDAGQSVDPESYARRFPELSKELRRHFANEVWVRGLGALVTRAASSAFTPPGDPSARPLPVPGEALGSYTLLAELGRGEWAWFTTPVADHRLRTWP